MVNTYFIMYVCVNQNDQGIEKELLKNGSKPSCYQMR